MQGKEQSLMCTKDVISSDTSKSEKQLSTTPGIKSTARISSAAQSVQSTFTRYPASKHWHQTYAFFDQP